MTVNVKDLLVVRLVTKQGLAIASKVMPETNVGNVQMVSISVARICSWSAKVLEILKFFLYDH